MFLTTEHKQQIISAFNRDDIDRVKQLLSPKQVNIDNDGQPLITRPQFVSRSKFVPLVQTDLVKTQGPNVITI